jgi:hypothetical protein
MLQPELTALDKPRQARQLAHAGRAVAWAGRAVAWVRPADAVH